MYDSNRSLLFRDNEGDCPRTKDLSELFDPWAIWKTFLQNREMPNASAESSDGTYFDVTASQKARLCEQRKNSFERLLRFVVKKAEVVNVEFNNGFPNGLPNSLLNASNIPFCMISSNTLTSPANNPMASKASQCVHLFNSYQQETRR